MEKQALNKYERYIKEKMGPAQIKKVTGLKDLSKMNQDHQMKLHDHIRQTAKERSNFASEVADKTKKKLPSGVKKTKGKLFGLLPGSKETTYGTGAERVNPGRERIRKSIDQAKLRNDRKRLLKRVATPETAIGGGLGYIVGKNAGEKETGRNKVMGTLGGAAIGNVLGNQLRKMGSLSTDNIKNLGMKKLDLKPNKDVSQYNKINDVKDNKEYKGGKIKNEIKGNNKGNSGPVFRQSRQGGGKSSSGYSQSNS